MDALRSGEYEQTIGVLKDEVGYCCLGVGAIVAGLGITETFGAYESIMEKFGLSELEKGLLTSMNDNDKKTFPEIADAIEQMLDGN